VCARIYIIFRIVNFKCLGLYYNIYLYVRKKKKVVSSLFTTHKHMIVIHILRYTIHTYVRILQCSSYISGIIVRGQQPPILSHEFSVCFELYSKCTCIYQCLLKRKYKTDIKIHFWNLLHFYKKKKILWEKFKDAVYEFDIFSQKCVQIKTV